MSDLQAPILTRLLYSNDVAFSSCVQLCAASAAEITVDFDCRSQSVFPAPDSTISDCNLS